MRRKIAAMTAGLILLQCIIPVNTGTVSGRTDGMPIYAAEAAEQKQTDLYETESAEYLEAPVVSEIEILTESESESEKKIVEEMITEQEATEAEILEREELETEIPETEIPETEIPDMEIPETEEPQTEIPETEEPETEIPDMEIPETEEPQTEIPETEESETQVPEPVIPYISAEKGQVYLDAFRTDGTSFTDDTVIRLRSLEELAEGSMEETALYRDMLLTPLYEQVIIKYMEYHSETEWTEELTPYLYDAVKEAVLTFEPLEVQFLYTDGSSCEPGELKMDISIQNQQIRDRFADSGSFVFPVWYNNGLQLNIPAGDEYSVSVSEEGVNISLSGVYQPSFLAVAELFNLPHCRQIWLRVAALSMIDGRERYVRLPG